MRVYLTFSRVALVLTGLWMAIGVPAGAFAAEPTSESPQVVIAEPSMPAHLLNYTEYYETADTKEPVKKEAAPSVEVNCGQECGTCQSDPGCAHWILGIETVWLSPQEQIRPDANYRIIDRTTVLNNYDGGVVSGLFITPRITLGYQGECWGVQTRYWRMSEANNQFTPAVDDSLSGENVDSLFKAETVDVEVTRMVYWRDTTNQVSVGFRYAQLEQSTNLSAVRQYGVGQDLELFSGEAYSRNEVSGAGLTMGLAGYKPLNGRNFSLFYSARGSFIFDDGAVNEVQTRADYVGFGSGGSVNGARAESNASMFIGEIQVGTQWNFELVKNRADAFVRLALEYQYWATDNTGYVWAESFAPLDTAYGLATATSSETRVDLVGFTVATGFTW